MMKNTFWAAAVLFFGAAVHAAEPAPLAVTRAVFARAVENREPVDTFTTLGNSTTRVYFFSEIRGMAGQSVMHRWEHNEKILQEVTFKIESSRWRAFSSKTLDPRLTGEWKVSVVDAAGSTLSVNTFSYLPDQKPDSVPAKTP
jgi:hypothetical protein